MGDRVVIKQLRYLLHLVLGLTSFSYMCCSLIDALMKDIHWQRHRDEAGEAEDEEEDDEQR